MKTLPFEFQIFGSKSSLDIDVMVFVDSIDDNPYQEIQRCKIYDNILQEFLNTDKELNTNLAIVKNSRIVKVLKGCEDECNNSLMTTYDLHQQQFPNHIRAFIERDVDLKIIRTTRVLLSLISRTEYRTIVKSALQKGFKDRINALYSLDITKITDLVNKNVSWEDFIKVYAFQLGQTLALIEGIELYTKEDIIEYYPDLKPYILRDISIDLYILEKYRIIFLDKVVDREMKSDVEYRYGEY
jgi:hypothetical protein